MSESVSEAPCQWCDERVAPSGRPRGSSRTICASNTDMPMMNEVQAKSFREEAGMAPCWLVWESATDGGRPYLIAVDTSEEQANRHVFSRKETARVMDKPPPMLHIERSWLDHLYGESMALSFDEAKKMVRELQSAQIATLKKKLARAVELARRAYMLSSLDDAQECLDELADLEKA